MNSPEKYPEKLFNELGIKKIHKVQTKYHPNGFTEHSFEIISSNKDLINELFNKCYLADADENTPRVIIGKLLLSAQRVCDSDMQNISNEIKNLKETIKQFDELY